MNILFSKLHDLISSLKEILGQTQHDPYLSTEYIKALWSLINSKGYDHKMMLEKIPRFKSNVILSTTFKKKEGIYECLLNKVHNYFNSKKRADNE